MQGSEDLGLMKVWVDDLGRFCEEALKKAGLSVPDAKTAADVLVTTDSWGIFTHGVKNLRRYVRRIIPGGIRSGGRPRVEREGTGWAIVDGDSALGMIPSTFAMKLAIEKARSAGISYVGVRNSCHFGAAGYYASLALREEMIGMAMCNDTPTVTVPGGKSPVLGSNPIAFAAPAGKENPILFDIATSTVAGGKVFAAAALGKKIPENWIVDADGKPTSDPSGFPKTGALTPMAAHKGYGLALMIETLSAVLTGAAIAQHVLSWSFSDLTLPTGHGAAFIVINVGAMMPLAEFKERMDQTVQEIRSAPKAAGAARIFIPGEMEWGRREKALREGIEFPEDVVVSIRALADELGWDLQDYFGRTGAG